MGVDNYICIGVRVCVCVCVCACVHVIYACECVLKDVYNNCVCQRWVPLVKLELTKSCS